MQSYIIKGNPPLHKSGIINAGTILLQTSNLCPLEKLLPYTSINPSQTRKNTTSSCQFSTSEVYLPNLPCVSAPSYHWIHRLKSSDGSFSLVGRSNEAMEEEVYR